MSHPLDDIADRYGTIPGGVGEAAAPPEDNGDGRTSPSPSRFRFIGSGEFAGADYRPNWLVKKILVKGQPGLIAGPSKSLKTSLLVDLAVSLASGREFLSAFDVERPVRVAIVSGESGEHTLQETARRVCDSKGITLDSLEGRLDWCFTLPTLADLDVMAEFAAELTRLKAEVVLIDPVYLALGNLDAKNMFEMGGALRVVAQVLLGAGCTPLLVHHANRQLPPGEPMELQHIAYSGLDQFARQFLLLNRREPYLSNGVHDLWVRVGGSVGHGGLWSLHVEEGELADDFGGREWRIKLETLNEVKDSTADRREDGRREAAKRKMAAEQTRVLEAIDAESTHHGAATITKLRERTGYGTPKVKEILGALIEDGIVVSGAFEKGGGNNAKQSVNGYRRNCTGVR